MVLDIGDLPLRAANLVEDGVPRGYGPRRVTLDKVLVDAAVAGGVEFRERFSVTDYVFDSGRLVGIRGRAAGGATVEERATLTIGADGRHSPLARAVQAPTYDEHPPILCYYFSYWSGVVSEPFELHVRTAHKRVVFSFRTEDNLYAIFVGLPVAELPAARRDIEGTFMRTLDLIPDLGARVRADHDEERFYGASDLPNFYRHPYGAGGRSSATPARTRIRSWLWGSATPCAMSTFSPRPSRRGSAGRVAGLGTGRLRIAQERGLRRGLSREYRRGEASFTPPPPEVLALRAAVRGSPDECTRLVKARVGMIDPASFFNPQNLQRLIGKN